MTQLIIGIVVVLLVGYVIATQHRRIRAFTAGLAAGTAVGDAVDAPADDAVPEHLRDEVHPRIEDAHLHDGSRGGFENDSLGG